MFPDDPLASAPPSRFRRERALQLPHEGHRILDFPLGPLRQRPVGQTDSTPDPVEIGVGPNREIVGVAAQEREPACVANDHVEKIAVYDEVAFPVAADGKRYLVIHGDLFDVIIRHARWLALLGSNAYDLAIWANTYFNRIRRAVGLTYWSLSEWAKRKVKNAMSFMGELESTLTAEARGGGAGEGVIGEHPQCRDPG